MEDNLLLQAIERYLDGTMLPAEKAYFEELRKNTPEIDQMVVEHSMFLHQMDLYSDQRNLKHQLHEVHTKLIERGDINEGGELNTRGRVIQLYNKYKRVTAIAASVGGVIALVISGLTVYFTPANNNQLQELRREVEVVKRNQQSQSAKLNEVDSKLPKDAILTGGGSGFLIDAKGYIITNAHVLKGSSFANVINDNHDEFKAKIIYRDEARDLAILKIEDEDYKPSKSLPYGFRKTDIDLGEEVFTLGYPRNDITYNKGDLSAKTGYNGDSTRWQLEMNANPGNSGGPVLDKNGEVIGVLSTREKHAEGVAFAIKSKNIFKMIEEIKDTDSSLEKIKLVSRSSIKGKDRADQIKEMEDCVFLVQAFNKK
ncbi:MAG: trypsin-like peptidase domain-containing protein [Bacteroidota bacterium]|nr:trypsin-like peptidase domain-containing protein [Bacteroidota bacterium]